MGPEGQAQAVGARCEPVEEVRILGEVLSQIFVELDRFAVALFGFLVSRDLV